MVIFNSYVKLPEGNHFKVFPIFFTLPTPSPPIPCALHRRNHPELRAASRFEGLTLQADGLGTERTGEFSKHPKVADFSRGCDGKYGNIMEIYGICHGNISWKISWEYDGKYHGKYDGKYDGNYGNMMGNLMDWWTWPSYSHQNQLCEYVIRDFCKWGSQSPTIPNRHMYGLGLPFVVPSAKHTKSYRKSPFLIDKPSISMGHGSHSYVSLPKGIFSLNHCSFRVYFDLLRLSSSFCARSLKNSPSFKTTYISLVKIHKFQNR